MVDSVQLPDADGLRPPVLPEAVAPSRGRDAAPGLISLVRPLAWFIAGLLLLLAWVLYRFDPSHSGFYPICWFHQITGLLCPGCGSLRALHQLLHGHLVQAFHFNPLLILSLPVLAALGWRSWLDSKRSNSTVGAISPKWLWVFLAIAVLFTIWRNVATHVPTGLAG